MLIRIFKCRSVVFQQKSVAARTPVAPVVFLALSLIAFFVDCHSDFVPAAPMLSPQSWHRPPLLDLQQDKTGTLGVPSDGLLAAGALSPDVQPNSPPLFIPHAAAAAAPPSQLKIGNYLLTERLPDMTAGIAVYSAVHVETAEKFICRVSYSAAL